MMRAGDLRAPRLRRAAEDHPGHSGVAAPAEAGMGCGSFPSGIIR